MPHIPEITVQQLDARLRSDDSFTLLDVREPWELESARILDPRLVPAPMSALIKLGLNGLPEKARSTEAELLILCHHGNRSGQVAAWLTAQGWTRAYSVAGGIDEYAARIDPSVGTY